MCASNAEIVEWNLYNIAFQPQFYSFIILPDLTGLKRIIANSMEDTLHDL